MNVNRVLTIKNRHILGTIIAYGVAAASTLINIPTVAIELNANTQVQTVEAHYEKPRLSVEDTVRTYFKDVPILAEIARCESQFTQINPQTGTVNRGLANPQDVGVMQINEYYHSKTAQKMGLELSKLEDNMAYARYLYEREGTKPWNASRACWQKQDNLLAIR